MGCKLAKKACPCQSAISKFAEVSCIDGDNYVCTREDGKQAKFPATDCDWIHANKMNCAYKNY